MPTTRRRVGRPMIRGPMPAGARWWLEHGRSPSIAEAPALGLTTADIWIASCLHFVRPTAGWLSRATLRELGYGPQIDQHVAHGRCPPDDWRHKYSAQVVPLGRAAR
jgi:hypothetical protein